MINEVIQNVSEDKNVALGDMGQVMDEIMTGKTTDIQISALLMGLTTKGETVDEIAGAANSMRSHATNFTSDVDAIDIVGTGGDKSSSFNISTTTGLVVASLGIPVAKHGNRAASSKSGAADVLEALGFNINLPVEISEKMLKDDHFCFMFAQKYHQAMKYVAPIRKGLGIRTIFNVLGPLANPAHVEKQVLGVYSEDLMEPLANVLVKIGVKHGSVIYGTDGLDEASISAPTKVIKINNGKLTKFTITPEQFGLKRSSKESIIGGSPEDNAKITRDILAGKKGAKRDVVLLNAGIAISAAKPELTIAQGIQKASEAIDSGKTDQLLQRLLKY